MPTELRVMVHIEELSVNPKAVRLPRTARVRDIAQRVYSRGQFIYGWDNQTKAYVPLPMNGIVSQIDERLRDSLLITRRELVSFISVKCIKWPGWAVAELDCRTGMVVRELARMFVFGLEDEPDAKFEVWREKEPKERLKLGSTLTEAGICDGDVVVVRVSSAAEEERAKALVDALKFVTMRVGRNGKRP
jgi:hypothetical protein